MHILLASSVSNTVHEFQVRQMETVLQRALAASSSGGAKITEVSIVKELSRSGLEIASMF